MNDLSVGPLFKVLSFLNYSDAIAVSQLDRSFREKILLGIYSRTFGQLRDPKPTLTLVARVISCAGKRPEPSTSKKSCVSMQRFKRWGETWKVDKDTELQEIYYKSLQLLESTQPTSIIQLQNVMHAFWQLDQQIKDYNIWYDGQLPIRPKLPLEKKLEERSREIFAKIGAFKLDDKDYDIAAFHSLADERSVHGDLDTRCAPFQSLNFCRTYIGIFAKNSPYVFVNNEMTHHLQVTIGREYATDQSLKRDEITLHDVASEHHIGESVLNRRHLVVGKHLEYRDVTQSCNGSDRVLDQKLTQIMMEIALQNRVMSVLVLSRDSQLPLLIAGGFHDTHEWNKRDELRGELKQFRAIEENKLFPSYEDHGRVTTAFKMKDLAEKNVLFLRETFQSWADIIEKAPLLNPNAAILPEYWVTKPMIVDG